MKSKIAMVYGTYNRLALLKQAVQSIRLASGPLHGPVDQIIVDAGSTDGTKEWLREQPDVSIISQTGALSGAVIAFNLGFALAVNQGYEYIGHFNDDAEFQTPLAIDTAVTLLEQFPDVGDVAFEFFLPVSDWNKWGFDYVANGKAYSNFGVARREVGMRVAQAQGDQGGRAWWNPLYHTYGADSEFGCWVWKLGFKVFEATGLRVWEHQPLDALRQNNHKEVTQKDGVPITKRTIDGDIFNRRWRSNPHVFEKGVEVPK